MDVAAAAITLIAEIGEVTEQNRMGLAGMPRFSAASRSQAETFLSLIGTASPIGAAAL